MNHTRIFSVTNPLAMSASVVDGSGGLTMQNIRLSKKRLDDKKTCRWVLDNGTICGKQFSKFDSLRRHVQELHKGIRPYVCDMCDKSYGRRDYLDRHIKTHMENAVGADGMVGVGDHSESCSVSVSVCGDDDMEHGDEDDNSSLTNVVTVITTDE